MGSDGRYTFWLAKTSGIWNWQIKRNDNTEIHRTDIGATPPALPVTLSIERNGDDYDFKVDGATIYTGTYYTAGVHDSFVYYHISYGSGNTGSLDATVDDFGVAPAPSATPGTLIYGK